MPDRNQTSNMALFCNDKMVVGLGVGNSTSDQRKAGTLDMGWNGPHNRAPSGHPEPLSVDGGDPRVVPEADRIQGKDGTIPKRRIT